MTDRAMLEALIAARCRRRHCLLTGRAATAITLALQAGIEKPGEVIIPSTICHTPAFSVMLAGHEPVFVDVNPVTLNLNVDTVRAAINERTRAIIAVHLFGEPCDMEGLSRLAAEHGLFLIEDAAQAPGALVQGRPAGSWGEASVLSFGRTKIIDAVEGGALLTDDDVLHSRAVELESSFSATAPYSSYENFAQELQELQNAPRERRLNLRRLAWKYRNLFLHHYDARHITVLEKELARLEENLISRAVAARTIRDRLEHIENLALTFQASSEGRVFHRLACRAESNEIRDVIVTALRAKHRWVGTLYPPLHELFDGKCHEFPVASAVGLTVINFILDAETLAREPIEETVRIIRAAVAQHQ